MNINEYIAEMKEDDAYELRYKANKLVRSAKNHAKGQSKEADELFLKASELRKRARDLIREAKEIRGGNKKYTLNIKM
jgi:hypothetical protein